MRRLILLAACASSLAACGSATPARVPEPVVRAVEVKVAVPVACIEAMPPRPLILASNEILARPNAQAGALFIDQHDAMVGYIGELEAVAVPCTAPVLPPESQAK